MNELNDFTKERIATAVIKALDDEKLLYKEVCEPFNTIPLYFTYLRNPKYWNIIPKKVWDRFRTWMYSGKKLKDYKFAGEILEEQKEPEETPTKSHVIEPVIHAKAGVKEAREKKLKERIKSNNPKAQFVEPAPEQSAPMKEAPDPAEKLRIKIKPEALKERKRVLAERKRKVKASPDKPPVTTNQTIRQGIFNIGTTILYRPSEAFLIEENKSLKSELKTVSTLFKNQFEVTERLRSELAFINAKFGYYHDEFFKIKLYKMITGTWWFKLFGRKFKNTE
jgi:hypothetical protein